jgi:hypothetical protein
MQRASGGGNSYSIIIIIYTYTHTKKFFPPPLLLLLELGCALAFHIFRRLMEKRVNAVIVSGGAVFAEAGVVLL